MKLVNRYIEKDGAGRVGLIPENPEDMWHAYNLISKGDTIRASTIRKVQTETATGSSSSSRVRTMLTIAVETIDFDTQACVLRLKGRNIEENQYVKMGAYHTVDIEPNRKFSLTKSCWDVVALERIDMACDPSQNADVAAVVMQEGLANVCLVTGAMTLVRAKIEVTIPRKRKGSSGQHEKGLQKFYDTVLQAILRHVNFEVTRCILIASPGFVKEHFFEYMMQWASKSDNRMLIENKSKFLLIHASSGFKHSLKEVLADPAVTSRMADTKAMAEVKALENFYSILQTEPSRAFYGLNHVLKANEGQAIDTLLVSDNLFRSQSVDERKKYVALVESVRDNGGVARIFSSLHVSGEQLMQLTGVAAVLRFPMPELEDEPLDSDDDSD
nr:EOG090X07BV [Scapholeberis mucronata]